GILDGRRGFAGRPGFVVIEIDHDGAPVEKRKCPATQFAVGAILEQLHIAIALNRCEKTTVRACIRIPSGRAIIIECIRLCLSSRGFRAGVAVALLLLATDAVVAPGNQTLERAVGRREAFRAQQAGARLIAVIDGGDVLAYDLLQTSVTVEALAMMF